MRIKSYFDSSIQTAMRQARHEFGDDVMLVTSRIASPEFRYLGDFEVVFAVDENEDAPEVANPPQPEPPETPFGEMFRLASAVPPAGDAREAAIAGIHSRLLDMALELATAEGMIALIRLCATRATLQSPLTGAAHDQALPPGNESVDGYGPVAGVESAHDDPVPSDRMSLEPAPTAIVPEPAAIDFAPRTEGSAIQSSPGRLPTGAGHADFRAARYPPLRFRASGVARQYGFPLMLAAFGLYRIIRVRKA